MSTIYRLHLSLATSFFQPALSIVLLLARHRMLSKPPTITSGKRLCKYADDTYRHLIISACNCHCQSAEFDDGPAVSNNLHLSRAISEHKLSLLKQNVAIPSTLWWEVKPTERNPQGRSPFFLLLGQNLTKLYPILLTLSDR